MFSRIFGVFLSVVLLLGCQDEKAQREAALRDAKKKEQIFENINKGWNFASPSLAPKTQEAVRNWAELRNLMIALTQKPQSSIGAFQRKSKELSKLALELDKHMPIQFNKPEVKSRISVLTTKINSINLYLNLQEVQDQKVLEFVRDANEELTALYRQLDEITRRLDIPKEQGEADMLRMRDTTRAIPSTPPPAQGQPSHHIYNR